MKELKIETKRGTLLDGVLFGTEVKADTVLICITGIHGNFYSNPFYYNIGNTLTAAGIDFIYMHRPTMLSGRYVLIMYGRDRKRLLVHGTNDLR